MKNPRTPGAGIAGAWISLGSDRFNSSIAPPGSPFKGRTLCAAALDREIDFLRQQRRHSLAERLAHQAAELRLSGVRVVWTPPQSGSLRDFCTAEFPSGATFHECGNFESNGKWWASPASKPQIGPDGVALKDDNGKTQYSPVVSFSAKKRRDLSSNAVIAAMRAEHPEVFA